MLSFLLPTCRSHAAQAAGRLARRAWLQIAGLSGLVSAGLSANRRTTHANEPAIGNRAIGFGRAKSVIVVFAHGGQSQIDMWDPKPTAPVDVRGAFAPIATRMPGVHICEHLPRVSTILDRCTLVRSMSHEDVDHGSAVYLALTGRYHPRKSSNPDPSGTDFPTLGAVVRRSRPRSRFVCDALHLNGPALVPTTNSPGQNGGFLGRGFEPWVVGDVLEPGGAFPGLSPNGDWSSATFDRRLDLKRTLDRTHADLDRLGATGDMNRWYGEASRLLDKPEARAAFDLERERPEVRDRYGRHRSGQSMLLARRLVEAGVPYVNVIWNQTNRGQDTAPDETDAYGWDTHNDIFTALRDRLLPRFDESFSALIEDLDQRGLLDETLVVCMGEFGRAPRVALERNFAGATPGRKHWAGVYSIVFAGAGTRRGSLVGQSDRLGAEPVTRRYGPWDVAATIFHALGIAPTGEFHDLQGRPFVIADGHPMTAIYE